MLWNSSIIFNRDLTLALQTLFGDVIPSLFSQNNFNLPSFFVNSLHLGVLGYSSIKQASWTRLFPRPLPSKIAGFYEIINVIYPYSNHRVLVFIAATWTCFSYFACSIVQIEPIVLSVFVGSSSPQLCRVFETEHLYLFFCHPSL